MTQGSYPFDGDLRERVAQLLFQLLPSLNRVRDLPPAGVGDLQRLPRVLAAPLTQEGWKRVLISQDLNLLRRERTALDVRPAILAEKMSGPLDAVHHAVDLRRSTATTGRYHPKDVTHFIHPTRLFPLREAWPRA